MPENTANGNPAAVRLGVNIDHVATVRNARGSVVAGPNSRRAARRRSRGRWHHRPSARRPAPYLRRRHRQPDLRRWSVPLNLEMAATAEMQAIGLRHRPHAVCIVPEKREEITTEDGLGTSAGEEKPVRRFYRAAARGRKPGFDVSFPPARREVEAAHLNRRPGDRTAHRRLLRSSCRRPISAPATRNCKGCAPWPRGRGGWGWKCMPGTV